MCDLFDLKHTGNFLSWRGKRHTHLVNCRLDRAMANSSWSDLFPNGRALTIYLSRALIIGPSFQPLIQK